MDMGRMMWTGVVTNVRVFVVMSKGYIFYMREDPSIQ